MTTSASVLVTALVIPASLAIVSRPTDGLRLVWMVRDGWGRVRRGRRGRPWLD